MSTVHPQPNPECDSRFKAVFDDIRATRTTAFVNADWQHLAFDPDLLGRTWAEVKHIMATPGALGPLTHEPVCLAVSIVNGRSRPPSRSWPRLGGSSRCAAHTQAVSGLYTQNP